MRNLKSTKHSRYKFGHGTLFATIWDATDDSLILAFGPSEDRQTITLKRLSNDAQDVNEATLITSWDAPPPNPDLAADIILDVHCFPETKSISLILAGGDVVLVREEPQLGEELIEIVGSIDTGIKAAAWSPDEEVIAVATGSGTLVLMTRDFESLADVTFAPDDFKVSNHVSVGWGKKETQFKGRGVAQTLRDPTTPEHIDEGTLSPFDDGEIAISWRGDGQYVAVNSVLGSKPDRRVIRVYSRDGTLESVSEAVNGLEGALSWKPSGQTIAGVQRCDDRAVVVFFERNGLRHGDFNLRLDKEELSSIGRKIELRWNTDSTVLAVCIQDRIQLWTMGNYHYYLKQEIRLSVGDALPARLTWHPEKPLHLTCFSSHDLRNLSYTFEACRGSVSPPNDLGTVAVIDGNILKVTPLRIANIPPPMAFDNIMLPHNALDVAINRTGTQMAVLHEDSVSVWTCDYSSKPAVKATRKSVIELPDRDADTIDGVSPDKFRRLQDCKNLYLRTDHDRIFFYEEEGDSSEPDLHAGDFSGDTTALIPVVWRISTGQTISFHRSEDGVLHLKQIGTDLIKISGCTSFIVTRNHLIYTTGQHLVKFVHLHDGDKLDIPADEPEKDERCRSIERGAKIVTVMPSAYSLVLQMPRGNLETIYPRALVLAGIRDELRKKNYKRALTICRTHRVDMNILHDYMPTQFMLDVELFVKQVNKTEYIDLFLSSLSEENVAETIYCETLAPLEEPLTNGITSVDSPHSPLQLSSKVNKICDTFLRVLQKDSSTRLQNIVTAHVCKSPPDLEGGLQLISHLRVQGQQERLEHAVAHICFLADVNQLYDAALGLYDLDVALLVAQQSQKDPREYLPYLQALHEMQPLRRQFSIDHDLKRHTKAITHLHALDTFDEMKTYAVKHELYGTAIDLCRYDAARLNELMRLYADYLSSRNRFKEAGVAYEYIADHASAYEAYRAVNMWRECLANASQVPLSPSDLSTLAQDLSNSLEESKDFQSSAQIHLDYLNDLEGAVRLLCKGYRFAEAIRCVTVGRNLEILRKILDPGLIEASATMTELLAEMRSQLEAQIPRLRDLRQKKVDNPMAFLDGVEGGDAEIPDNISLAPTDASTSGATFMTRYTNQSTGTLATNATRKTSKNRRREERKRAKGKKGTVYEEEYLVSSVARLIERLNDIGADVGELVQCLMRRSMRERAIAVQTAVEEVRGICRECMDEVFASTNKASTLQQEGMNGTEADVRPWGGQGVLWDAVNASKVGQPLLKSFESLSLLE